MTTDADGREWPTPGRASHSVLDPAGPFRPVRRLLLYVFAGTLALIVVAGGLGAIGVAILMGSGLGTVGLVWLFLWFVDTVLAYLKR